MECGIIAGGAHWSFIASLPTYSTTTVRTGLRSLRVNPSAEARAAAPGNAPNTDMAIFRVYFYVASNPTGDTFLMGARAATANAAGLVFKSSDGQVYAGGSNGAAAFTFGATGVTVTTGAWHRADIRVNSAANPWVVDAQIDGGTALSVSPAYGASATLRFIVGAVDSATCDIFYDDALGSATSGDYPLGAGYVISYIPNADGTHNIAGANDFERTLTGTDITNATTDAVLLIDDRPLESAAGDFINGVAPPNATDYVEWQYENNAEATAPRTVEAIFGHHDAGGAGTNNFTVTLRRDATSDTSNIFSGTTNVGATMTFKRAHFATAPGGATWTTAIFDDLRSRFLVSDASPDPYIDGVMLEAEFSGAAPPAAANDPMLRMLMGIGMALAAFLRAASFVPKSRLAMN